MAKALNLLVAAAVAILAYVAAVALAGPGAGIVGERPCAERVCGLVVF